MSLPQDRQEDESSDGSLFEAEIIHAVNPNGSIYDIAIDETIDVVSCDYFHTCAPTRAIAIRKVDDNSENETGELIYYLLKNLNDTTGFVSIKTSNDVILATYTFSVYDEFLAAELWPSIDNFIIAITRESFYFFDLDKIPIRIGIVRADRALDMGIALVEKLNDHEAIFAVPSPVWPRKVNHFILNKENFSVVYSHNFDYAQHMNGPCLPMHVRGIGFVGGNLISAHQKDVGHSFFCFYLNGYRSNTNFFPINITDIAVPIEEDLTIPVQQATGIVVTTREYNAKTGVYVQDVDELHLGSVQPRHVSDHSVIDMRVSGVPRIENVRLGIIDYKMGERPYSENLLVAHSPTFETIVDSFESVMGINENSQILNQYNIKIGTKVSLMDKSQLESEYVYMKVAVPNTFTGKGYFQMKWFFDYEEE